MSKQIFPGINNEDLNWITLDKPRLSHQEAVTEGLKTIEERREFYAVRGMQMPHWLEDLKERLQLHRNEAPYVPNVERIR